MSKDKLGRSRWVEWGVTAVLAIIVIGLQSYFLYQIYTTQFPGANDFLARWSNGCAYFWDGINPYSDEATLQTQMRMYGRPAELGEDLAAFSYPLYTLFFFVPLCAIRDYAVVQAIWMSLMIVAVVAGTALMMPAARWQPNKPLLVGILVWTILVYPHLRAIILGQMATVVFVALALCLLAMQKKLDFWAGVALAVATLKPQMTYLVVPWLLLWSGYQRRWSLWVGFTVNMVLMSGVALLLVPTWPLDFINAIRNYDTVAGLSNYHSLIWMVTRRMWDLGASVEYVVTIGFYLYLIFEWWQNRDSGESGFLWTTGLTFNLTQFVAYRIATTSYTILLLPLFQIFALVQRKQAGWRGWVIIVATLLFLFVGQWGIFLATRDGNFETIPAYLLLPISLFVAQIVSRRYLVRAEGSAE
ncbi:MAG TPA: glycosyltransferase family 87 protein [Anaerolineae bacterium]|nr:glycosyltransferase family 87 protein [Anaerolineae bacterium]